MRLLKHLLASMITLAQIFTQLKRICSHVNENYAPKLRYHFAHLNSHFRAVLDLTWLDVSFESKSTELKKLTSTNRQL